MRFIFFLFCLCIYSLNAQPFQRPTQDFDKENHPAAPDYSLERNWAALPNRVDECDFAPKGYIVPADSEKQIDVFYIHPTVYGKGDKWNADLQDEAVNKLVLEKPLKYQASAWNESCRIFAPFYRQAILASFFDTTGNGKKALDFAYQDVKNAFLYYVKNYNQGRPFVIAAHSQGSKHAKKLIKELIDETPLKNKLVCAYLIGMPVVASDYKNILEGKSPTQTGCILSWNTFKEGYEPEKESIYYKNAIATNPITWRADTLLSDLENHAGMVLLNFNKCIPQKVVARVHKNYLWAKVNYPILKNRENLHIVDVNLFWADIRKDVKRRIGYFWKY